MTFHRMIFRIPGTHTYTTIHSANVCNTLSHSMTNNILHFNYSNWISVADVFRILILSSPLVSIGCCFNFSCLNAFCFLLPTNEFYLFNIIVIIVIIRNEPRAQFTCCYNPKCHTFHHVRVEKRNFISFDRQCRLLTSAQVHRSHFLFLSTKTKGEQQKSTPRKQHHLKRTYNKHHLSYNDDDDDDDDAFCTILKIAMYQIWLSICTFRFWYGCNERETVFSLR